MTTTDDKTQAASLHGPNLILDVENFGPIAEAKNIEFKPMTVFVGPSNTGKTYLAMVLHALFRSTQSLAGQRLVRHKYSRNLNDVYNEFNPLSISEHVASLIEPIVNDARAQNEAIHIPFPISDLPDQPRSEIQRARRNFLESYVEDAFDDVLRVFELPDLQSMRPHGTSTEVQPSIGIRDPHNRIRLSISERSVIIGDTHRPLFFRLVPSEFPFYISRRSDHYFEYFTDLVYEAVESYIADVIEQFPDSYYFLTGRSGMLEMYREWIAQLINKGAGPSLSHDSNHRPAFNVINIEFLSWLISLRPKMPLVSKKSSFHRVADVIESSILKGSISIEEFSGITEIGYEQNGNTIPIERASSMVTELAPVVLFIRQFVNEGDLLIIDEPEAHLHPEAQQQMAAALAFMVRSGLRVLITTHSHYMVEQLSAFVNASKLDETTRKRALSLGGALGEEDIYLNEDETAVYSFKMSQEHGGSVVEEIFMGEEFEYGSDDHTDATVEQFNRLQRVLEAREAVEFGDLD